ncbi:hypothetical protein [Pseudomonas sp. UMAB-08]|uniref:hypothetical protein n=1 Tax=Pseudomonas sp. UMAB-08 TaxID=1365375 RepID=UPI001C592722|nr:hypothetical protein [Pseudomonas sp. UMAB-08]
MTALTLRVMRFDQRNQTFPEHDLIHLNQKTLATELLAFTSVFGISEWVFASRPYVPPKLTGGLSDIEIL